MARTTQDLNGRRVALYARYSSDRQSDTSIEDQVARCRRFVEERGGDVVDVFTDYATSGSSLKRPGWDALMRAVEGHRVDVVVAESLDRVSRDVADSATLFRRLQHLEVPLLGVGDRTDTSDVSSSAKVGRYVKTIFSELYVDEVRDRTLRALEERARAGLATGGLPYGYRSKPREDGKREIEIDAAQASTVRRVFEEYSRGRSKSAIAAALNAAGVAPPRSSRRTGSPTWASSTIRTIIFNARYIGVWSFNERQWTKIPGTNIRRPRLRDGADVIRIEREDLRIVPQELWDVVHERALAAGAPARARHRQGSGKRRYLLSGLLRCDYCSSVLSVHGGDVERRYYRCSSASYRGTCDARRSYLEAEVRGSVLELLRDELLSPAAARATRAAIAEELGRARRALDGDRGERRARLARTEQRIRGLVTFLADGDRSVYVVDALRDLEAQARSEKAALAELERRASIPLELPSPDFVLERLRALDRVLDGVDVSRGRELLELLVDESGIRLRPEDDGGYTGRMGVYPERLLYAPQKPGRGEGLPSDVQIAGAGYDDVRRPPRWLSWRVAA